MKLRRVNGTQERKQSREVDPRSSATSDKPQHQGEPRITCDKNRYWECQTKAEVIMYSVKAAHHESTKKPKQHIGSSQQIISNDKGRPCHEIGIRVDPLGLAPRVQNDHKLVYFPSFLALSRIDRERGTKSMQTETRPNEIRVWETPRVQPYGSPSHTWSNIRNFKGFTIGLS